MIAARAAIKFGRVLRGYKVVGHRDHGKKDQDDHRQSDQLRPPCALAQSMAHPQPEHERSQQRPGEIEGQLYSCSDSTSRAIQEWCSPAGLTGAENPLMMDQLAFVAGALPWSLPAWLQDKHVRSCCPLVQW